jgi:hypothetical protein
LKTTKKNRVNHKYRKGDYMKKAVQVLETWHEEAHQHFYHGTPLPKDALLSDKALTQIHVARWYDLNATTVVPIWDSLLATRHAAEVMGCLHELDEAEALAIFVTKEKHASEECIAKLKEQAEAEEV